MIKFTVLYCYFTWKYYVQNFIYGYLYFNDLKKLYKLKISFHFSWFVTNFMLEMKEITEDIYIDKISDIDTKVVGIDSFLITILAIFQNTWLK